MDKRMLINAVHSEESRIAIIEDRRLVELEFESNSAQNLKGNIYKAKISRIEPSLQAAFLNMGTKRNGFLQINDIHPSYFKAKPNGKRNGRSRVKIQDVLETGQELVVQVVKEERDLKGATLTTYPSIPGRYLVLMPGSDRGGVSRKIIEEKQRTRLRALCKELEIPAGIGVIIRTAGMDRSLSELSRDLTILLKEWEHVVETSQNAVCPEVLYQENDVATRVMRDYFTPDIREVLIDDKATFDRVKRFVARTMPRYRSRIKLYSLSQPIFSHFDLDTQIENTLNPEVHLPSGGSIVIESLEALVAIDVNSGKATQGASIEETALKTNMEAAEEVARQLRLRDLGGLVVVDFIDMLDRRNKIKVEKKLKESLVRDKARVETGRLSKFGLMELSRQRLRAPLNSQSHLKCPTCQGSGRLRHTELVALEVLRKIQSAIVVGHVSVVKARLAPGPALFLLNNKRRELSKLEENHGVQILILADGRLRPDDYQFEMTTDKTQLEDSSPAATVEDDNQIEDSESLSAHKDRNDTENKDLPVPDEEGEQAHVRYSFEDGEEEKVDSDDAELSKESIGVG